MSKDFHYENVFRVYEAIDLKPSSLAKSLHHPVRGGNNNKGLKLEFDKQYTYIDDGIATFRNSMTNNISTVSKILFNYFFINLNFQRSTTKK